MPTTTRYREREEVRAWGARDPLTRLRTHLTGVGALTAELEAEYAAGAERIAAAMREALNTDTDIDPEDLFRFVTETRSPARGAVADAPRRDRTDAGGGCRRDRACHHRRFPMTIAHEDVRVDERPSHVSTMSMAAALNLALADAIRPTRMS